MIVLELAAVARPSLEARHCPPPDVEKITATSVAPAGPNAMPFVTGTVSPVVAKPSLASAMPAVAT